MPLYTYRCPACGDTIEQMRGMDNRVPPPRCEDCDVPMEQVIQPAMIPPSRVQQ